jgi:aminoglycoside/choline kinase family phosphotransferase
MTDSLKQLFEQHFHFAAEYIQPLQTLLGASDRKLFRLTGNGVSAIGVLHSVREENIAFLEFSRHFRRHGLPVPEIYAQDLARGAYLEEDLGHLTLFDFLAQNRRGSDVAPAAVEAYRTTLSVLPRFQVEAAGDLNYKRCYPRASFDRQSIIWDLNYFKYYFLQLAGIAFNEHALERDFRRFTNFLLEADRGYFLYRDFQSRNVMLREGLPWFLDYQGGRKGALQYDVASLLYDATADLPPALRQQLLDYYLDVLASFLNLDRATFMRHYYGYVYVRLMQALGAYGFRGFYQRKTLFLQSVPYAVKNLRWLLHNVHLPIKLPVLMNVLQQTVAAPRFQLAATEPDHLVVRITSFSFHRGVPVDDSGHGGGFVFDARSLPNPGREERFKSLSGKDAAVIEYLDRQEAIPRFLNHVTSLIDATVDEYQRRGFNSLAVSFGCTGGQHRSVYLAEQLAKHLRGRNGVEVKLLHRELENSTA